MSGIVPSTEHIHQTVALCQSMGEPLVIFTDKKYEVKYLTAVVVAEMLIKAG